MDLDNARLAILNALMDRTGARDAAGFLTQFEAAIVAAAQSSQNLNESVPMSDSDDVDHTDVLMDALHEASQNGGRLLLPQELIINGRRYDSGEYELRWMRPLPIRRQDMEDHPF